MKNDQHKTIVRLIYSFYSFEKIFFSLTVDYDVIDHVTLGWLEECSPQKNKSRLWTLQDSVERTLVPKFVRLLEKNPCLSGEVTHASIYLTLFRAWFYDNQFGKIKFNLLKKMEASHEHTRAMLVKLQSFIPNFNQFHLECYCPIASLYGHFWIYV